MFWLKKIKPIITDDPCGIYYTNDAFNLTYELDDIIHDLASNLMVVRMVDEDRLNIEIKDVKDCYVLAMQGLIKEL